MSKTLDIKIVEKNIDIHLIENMIVPQILNQAINVKNKSQEIKAEVKTDDVKVKLDKALVYYIQPPNWNTIKDKSLYWWGAVQSINDLKNIDTCNENYNRTGGLVLVLDRLALYAFKTDVPLQNIDGYHIITSNFTGFFELFTAQTPRLTTTEMLSYTPRKGEEVYNINLQKIFRFIKQRWRET